MFTGCKQFVCKLQDNIQTFSQVSLTQKLFKSQNINICEPLDFSWLKNTKLMGFGIIAIVMIIYDIAIIIDGSGAEV